MSRGEKHIRILKFLPCGAVVIGSALRLWSNEYSTNKENLMIICCDVIQIASDMESEET